MLGHLKNKALAVIVNLEGVLNSRKVAFERDIDNGADDLTDFADIVRHFILLRVWVWFRLHRFGAGDNFDQFLGDGRLAGPVIDQGQAFDQVARIASRVVHGGHPCRQLGGR